jgi:hypothetical protein
MGLVLVGMGLGPCFPAAITLSGSYIAITPNVGSMFVIGSAGAGMCWFGRYLRVFVFVPEGYALAKMCVHRSIRRG